jgi:hypothetical protein
MPGTVQGLGTQWAGLSSEWGQEGKRWWGGVSAAFLEAVPETSIPGPGAYSEGDPRAQGGDDGAGGRPGSLCPAWVQYHYRPARGSRAHALGLERGIYPQSSLAEGCPQRVLIGQHLCPARVWVLSVWGGGGAYANITSGRDYARGGCGPECRGGGGGRVTEDSMGVPFPSPPRCPLEFEACGSAGDSLREQMEHSKAVLSPCLRKSCLLNNKMTRTIIKMALAQDDSDTPLPGWAVHMGCWGHFRVEDLGGTSPRACAHVHGSPQLQNCWPKVTQLAGGKART